MAVVDIYVNEDTENGKLAQAAKCQGNKVVTIVQSFETGATDGNGSVYRVFPDLNPCLIPVDIKIMNDATGAANSDFDLGLYCGEKGEVIDADCFYDGLNIKTANTGTPVNGLSALDIANIGKQLFEIAGHTIANRKDTYDIALTANTAPAAAGTVTVVGTFLQG